MKSSKYRPVVLRAPFPRPSVPEEGRPVPDIGHVDRTVGGAVGRPVFSSASATGVRAGATAPLGPHRPRAACGHVPVSRPLSGSCRRGTARRRKPARGDPRDPCPSRSGRNGLTEGVGDAETPSPHTRDTQPTHLSDRTWPAVVLALGRSRRRERRRGRRRIPVEPPWPIRVAASDRQESRCGGSGRGPGACGTPQDPERVSSSRTVTSPPPQGVRRTGRRRPGTGGAPGSPRPPGISAAW